MKEEISISIKVKTVAGEVYEGQLEKLKRVNDLYEEGRYSVTLITDDGAEILLRGVSGDCIEFKEHRFCVV